MVTEKGGLVQVFLCHTVKLFDATSWGTSLMLSFNSSYLLKYASKIPLAQKFKGIRFSTHKL